MANASTTPLEQPKPTRAASNRAAQAAFWDIVHNDEAPPTRRFAFIGAALAGLVIAGGSTFLLFYGFKPATQPAAPPAIAQIKLTPERIPMTQTPPVNA